MPDRLDSLLDLFAQVVGGRGGPAEIVNFVIAAVVWSGCLLAEKFPEAAFGEADGTPRAIELVARQEWDLVLLDINLPGRGGLEVLAEARRLRPSQRICSSLAPSQRACEPAAKCTGYSIADP